MKQTRKSWFVLIFSNEKKNRVYNKAQLIDIIYKEIAIMYLYDRTEIGETGMQIGGSHPADILLTIGDQGRCRYL